MRLWSIHPKYLDSKGLTALWREGLLAKKVLEGKTKGYIAHPQLDRFREQTDPAISVQCYLAAILTESRLRGYRFDASKIDTCAGCESIAVPRGQIEYEWRHLLDKLSRRDPKRLDELRAITIPELHPIFFPVEGGIAEWEKPKSFL